jgi:hypothetical protein
MEFISIFFILLSLVVIAYLIHLFKSTKRLPVVFELFAIGVYAVVIVIFLFPETLRLIENMFKIQSALNFMIYLSIFVAYLFIFTLYNEKEQQRIEITKLTREIAILRKEKKYKK